MEVALRPEAQRYQSLLLLRVAEVEPAAELGLGPGSWLLQLSLGGEVRAHSPGDVKEYAWEVSQLARRHLDLRVALRKRVLLRLSQFLGEAVIPIDLLLEQLRVGAVASALWFDLVSGSRRRGRVRLAFRLAFSSRDSFNYLALLHEQAVRVLREGGEEEEEALTETESEGGGGLSASAGVRGYQAAVAAPRPPLPPEETETEEEASAEEPFLWATGPQIAEQLGRVQVWAEESYAGVKRGGRFGALLAARAARQPRLAAALGEEAAETGRQLLDLMIAGVRNPAVVPESFREAARRLAARGLGEPEYGLLGRAALWALRAAAAEAQGSWTDRVEFAWRAAFTLAARTLLELARPQQMRAGLLPPALGALGAEEADAAAAAARRFSFNSRFQTALERIWRDARDAEAWVAMAEVAKDFEEAAQMYGRVIVLERFLPDRLKTIKPVYLGTLGGAKYCHGGIFFKLATADGALVTSMEGAAKVAGHELKGCSCYFQARIAGLHVPLTSLIDFAGFRLVAMCELPISPRSLVVGSADGGATLAAADGRMLAQLRAAARVLNLKEHVVGRLLLSAAADLEGHLSPLDGRRYLVDFSRVMPPHPAGLGRGDEARFVALLRPELVQQAAEPLNPDVGSGFCRAGTSGDDPDDLRGVRVAAEMLKTFCATVAREAGAQAAAAEAAGEGLATLQERLSRLCHSHGVNMRMLGAVLSHATHAGARRVLLVEMASRTIKRIMRARWREVMACSEFVMSGPLLHAAAACFTDVFCSPSFWSAQVYPAMEAYFGFYSSAAELAALVHPDAPGGRAQAKAAARVHRSRIVSAPAVFGKDPEEVEEPVAVAAVAGTAAASPRLAYAAWVPLRENAVLRALLFGRLCQQLGVEFAPRVTAVYLRPEARLPPLAVDATDVLSLQPRLKSLKIVAHSRAMALMARAHPQADRGALVAAVSGWFERALDGPLVSSQLLRSYAECLAELCPRGEGAALLRRELGSRAEALFRRAVEANPRAADARLAYASWRELCEDMDGARLHLLRGIMLAPHASEAPAAYLRLLRRLEMNREAAEFEAAMPRGAPED